MDDALRSKPHLIKVLLRMADKLDPIEPEVSTVRRRVRDRLHWQLDKNGARIRPLARIGMNTYYVLAYDPEFAGKIWMNDFTATLMYGDRPFSDTDSTTLRMRVLQLYAFEPSKTTVDEVVQRIGDENRSNPLQEYLLSLEWDNSKRISQYPAVALKAGDSRLYMKLFRKWMIQAVARAMEPGCKADYSLILVGKQGARKSTSFKVLAGEQYFSDTPIDIGNRHGYMQLANAWIYELSELESIRRRDNNQVKAFLTSTEDTYVKPYGRYIVRAPRHVVFCGTTNRAEFLTDATGSRRFWTIPSGDNIDLDWIEDNRDQLWAEAVAAYMAGEKWYLEGSDEDLLAEHNEQFREADPWWQPIYDYAKIHKVGGFSTRELMSAALKLDNHQMNRATEMRVSDLLVEMGYVKVRSGADRRHLWKESNNVVELESLKGGADG